MNNGRVLNEQNSTMSGDVDENFLFCVAEKAHSAFLPIAA
jgi:hypothetical protein